MSKILRSQTPERKAYMKAWHAANPRDRRAYKSAYDEANKEKNRAYLKSVAEHRKANKKQWYQANRERILARVKEHATTNREKILAYQADYYVANTDKVKARVSEYRRANPEKKRQLENHRRVRKAGNGGSHTVEERLEKFAALGNVCYYCKQAKKLTIDHDIPLARGGTDDIENILPACRSCNSRKNAKTSQEFIELHFGRTNHTRTGGIGEKTGEER